MLEELKKTAARENVSPAFLKKNLAKGSVVLLGKEEKKLAVGYGTTTKTNANLGFSSDYPNEENEYAKLKTAEEAGADTVMDLSIGGSPAKLDETLSNICKRSRVPVGSVPAYRAFSNKKIEDVTEDDLMKAVEKQAQSGADFLTIHAAITLENHALARKRVLGITSRGGSLLTAWMHYHKKQNPFYARFNEVLEIAKQKEVCVSIGDALRPGAIADANDAAQLSELRVQSELVKQCRKTRTPVICEGPGHMPLDKIRENVLLQKRLCDNAPYYVLGPLTTDLGAGHDHVTATIGGAIAAAAGADYLCVVTPSEHLSLPSTEDIKEGVIAARIAAHSGDLVKLGYCKNKDYTMSLARAKLDWRKQITCALDPETARKYRSQSPSSTSACSMCGEYCAIKQFRKCLKPVKQ